MTIGNVIILNGVSSSGKSSLAHALQERLSQPYLHCSLDAFWNMTPRGMPANSINFPMMKQAMALSVRALVDTGHSVIVDIIYSGKTTHLDFVAALDEISVLVVKVECPLAELERRERSRGDRAIGLARSQLTAAHQSVPYDLEVSTSAMSPELCAERIAERMGASTHGCYQAASDCSTYSG